MIRICIPIWGQIVSPVLDTAVTFLLVDCETHELDRQIVCLESRSGGDDHVERVQSLRRWSPDFLICGAISRGLSRLIELEQIVVIPWVTGNADAVVNAFITGQNLPGPFLMPGCPRRKHKIGKGHHRRGQRDTKDFFSPR